MGFCLGACTCILCVCASFVFISLCVLVFVSIEIGCRWLWVWVCTLHASTGPSVFLLPFLFVVPFGSWSCWVIKVIHICNLYGGYDGRVQPWEWLGQCGGMSPRSTHGDHMEHAAKHHGKVQAGQWAFPPWRSASPHHCTGTAIPYTGKQAAGQTCKQIDWWTDSQTHRQTVRHTGRQMDSQIDRGIDSQADG